MADESNPILVAALSYAARGWRVVPLLDRDKLPRLADWQHKASVEEKTIRGWWRRWPGANVGVVMGKASGLIDIECDSEEQEAEYLALFGEDPPVTCCFAGARGKHRLFAWRPDLPPGGIIHLGGIGIRVGNCDKGAQSVFPPSLHPSGVTYQWLVLPDDCPPAQVPKPVLIKLWNLAGEDTIRPGSDGKPIEYWQQLLCGVPDGKRNEAATQLIGWWLHDLADITNTAALARIEAQLRHWNTFNKPPLDEKELHNVFESILRTEREKRSNAKAREVEPEIERRRKRDPASGRLAQGGWRLIRVTSIPPRFKLFSPLWNDCLVLTAEQYCSVLSLRRVAIEQVNVWLPRAFRKLWEGSQDNDPLAQQLLDNLELEQDEEDAQRPWVVAMQLYTNLTDAPTRLESGQEPDSRGMPCVTAEGAYLFGFDEVFRSMARGDDKIKRHELTALMRELGAKKAYPRIAGRMHRRHVLSADGFAQLEAMIRGAAHDQPRRVPKPEPHSQSETQRQDR